VDNNDNIHIVWQDDRDGNDEVYYTKLDNEGTTLVDDTRLTDNGAESSWPKIDMDGSNNIHIVWRDLRNGSPELYYTKLDASGNDLVDDMRLTFGSNNSSGNYLGVDGSGNIHVVWVDFRDANAEIYYQKLDNNGGSLLGATRLTTAGGDSWWPMLDFDGTGNIHIIWYDSRTGEAEVFYKKLDSGGATLVDDTQVTSTGTGPGAPHLGVDDSGNIHIIWHGLDDGIHYTKLDNLGNTQIADISVPASRASTAGYWSEVDGNDVHVVWSDDRGSSDEVYYIKLDDSGNVLTSGVIITRNDSSCWWPRICIDSSHEYHISWDDDGEGNREVYYTNEAMIAGAASVK
jgi:hypothetical protein